MLSAINASLSPATSWDERQRIEAYLQQQKQSPVFVSFLSYILSTEAEAHTISVRLMTLSLLQDWIATSWNSLNVENQTAVLQSILGASGSASITGAPKSFKVKLASVLANIALRQFPQLWSTFIEDMLRMIVSGSGSEIAVLVLNYTITDCIDSDLSSALPTLRKQEVLGGIKSQLPVLLTVVYSTICQQLHTFLGLRARVSTASEVDASYMQCTAIISTTQSTLEMLVPIVSFGKAIEVCAPDHNFLELAIELIQSQDFQLEALTLLRSITQQSLQLEMAIKAMLKLCDLPITVVPDDPDELLQFHSQYAESSHSLLVKNQSIIAAHLVALKKSKDREESRCVGGLLASSVSSSSASVAVVDALDVETVLGRFCLLLIQLLKYPAPQISISVISDWIKVTNFVPVLV